MYIYIYIYILLFVLLLLLLLLLLLNQRNESATYILTTLSFTIGLRSSGEYSYIDR